MAGVGSGTSELPKHSTYVSTHPRRSFSRRRPLNIARGTCLPTCLSQHLGRIRSLAKHINLQLHIVSAHKGYWFFVCVASGRRFDGGNAFAAIVRKPGNSCSKILHGNSTILDDKISGGIKSICFRKRGVIFDLLR